MKITLCGKPGSGKSTLAKELAKEFKLKHYSTGDLMRKIAAEKGYKIEDYMKVVGAEIDNEVDRWVEKIGKTEENFIFDSRMAFNFIPDAIKIYLDVSFEEGAKRVFLDPRESEKKAKDWRELATRNEDRWETDRKRLLKLYGADMDNKKNYDFYIDTTGKEIEYVIREVKRIIRASSKV